MFGAPLTEVDPASFGDPLALKVSWVPLQRSLLSHGSRRIVEPASGRIELRPTAGAVAQAVVFLLPGLALLGLAAATATQSDAPAAAIPFGLLGLIATLLTGLLLWRRLQPQVFDRGAGLYWTGANPPATPDGVRSCRLQSIHALQLVRWKLSGRNQPWHNELNLALKDGSRVGVVTVTDLDNVRQCAGRLAQLWGCKVWDATDPRAQKKLGSAAAQRVGTRILVAIIALMVIGAISTAATVFQSKREFAERERAEQAAMAEQARKREARRREFEARAKRAEQARRAQAQVPTRPAGPNPGEDWEVVAAAPRTPPPDAGRNRLENTSFEADPGAAWRFDPRGAGVTGDWSPARALAGARALRVWPTHESGGVWRSTTRYPITAGTMYLLRTAARAEGGARAAVGATYFDAEGRKLGRHNCFCLDLPGGEWHSLDVAILAGRYPGATAVELELVGCPTGRPAATASPVVDFDEAFFGAVTSASNNCAQQAPPAGGKPPG